MYRLVKPREVLLQYGFIHSDQEKRYIRNLNNHDCGGELFINDDEDFFRVEMLCAEFLESCDQDIFVPEHIAERNDSVQMEDIIINGVVIWERPALTLDDGMKLFAIDAGYRNTNIAVNWPHYVRAKNFREARQRFKSRITWLDVYGVREVTDTALIQDVLSSPRKYICF